MPELNNVLKENTSITSYINKLGHELHFAIMNKVFKPLHQRTINHMKIFYLSILLGIVNQSAQAQCNSAIIYANDSTHAVCFETTVNTRKIFTNNIPDHTYGPFGGPNTIGGQDFEYNMCLYPTLNTFTTPLSEDTTSQACGGGIVFGLSHQGVLYSPFARLYFTNPNTQEENKGYEIEAEFTLNMDLNGGHINKLSRYHYHNVPSDYLTNDLGVNGSSFSPLLGYAADGFPIYYKYLYTNAMDSTSGIIGFQSDYILKTGNRTGNGITAPNGTYDGTYIQDYEQISTQSELDECGGRYGVTPEYPDGTYYYVLTDNWPYIPRCLSGKFIDNTFKIGLNCPPSASSATCSTSSTVSIEEATRDISLTIFPNPTNTELHLNIENNMIKNVTSLMIYNSASQIVFTSESFQENIQIKHLSSGTYYLQLEIENNQITKKIIIQ